MRPWHSAVTPSMRATPGLDHLSSSCARSMCWLREEKRAPVSSVASQCNPITMTLGMLAGPARSAALAAAHSPLHEEEAAADAERERKRDARERAHCARAPGRGCAARAGQSSTSDAPVRLLQQGLTRWDAALREERREELRVNMVHETRGVRKAPGGRTQAEPERPRDGARSGGSDTRRSAACARAHLLRVKHRQVHVQRFHSVRWIAMQRLVRRELRPEVV